MAGSRSITVGNLQARAIGSQANNSSVNPLHPASTTQVPYPGFYNYDSMNALSYYPLYSSETYLDSPLWDHTSHVGFSVNEINPKFALQNAPSNVYRSTNPGPNPTLPNPYGTNYSQFDNVGVNVALTQLRNILAGTKPLDPTGSNYNGDTNSVYSDGLQVSLPNNIYDPSDISVPGPGGLNVVTRNTTTVPGRWGEPQGVPSVLTTDVIPISSAGDPGITYGYLNQPSFYYNNPVRAGRSIYTSGTQYNVTNDALDDDFDGTDPYLASAYQIGTNNPPTFNFTNNLGTDPTMASGNYYTLPLTYTNSTPSTTIIQQGRSFPEFVDYMDGAGQFGIATERIRRYVTPIDPSGSGRLVSFMNRPNNDHDYGTGSDNRGRMGYYRYFRPGGMPQEVRYPYLHPATTSFPYLYNTGSGDGQRFLMPVMFPSGYAQANGPIASRSDTHNNRFHGFQSYVTPAINAAANPKVDVQTIAAFAAMPRDWDMLAFPDEMGNFTPSIPDGGSSKVSIVAPMINPLPLIYPTNLPPIYTGINTELGPNVGFAGNVANVAATYPIPYGGYSPTYPNLPQTSPVVNGYLGGSLNKDEADEMNVYTQTRFRHAVRPQRPGVALPQTGCRWDDPQQPVVEAGADFLQQPGRRLDPPSPLLHRRLRPDLLRLRQR